MWDAIRNQFVFPLRRRIPSIRRKPYSESLGEESFSQDFLPEAVAERLSPASLRMACYYAWILEQIPFQGPRVESRALDLGSKNFFYAPALYEWLQKRNGPTSLTGLEADPGRLYQDLYRRGDYARYYVSLMNKHYPLGPFCEFQEGNWLKYPRTEAFDLITSFFPFIYDDLSDRWGLPRRFFDPLQFYEKAADQAPWVLFFHQGKDEVQDSLSLIKELGRGHITFEKMFDENPYLKRKHPTGVLLWKTR